MWHIKLMYCEEPDATVMSELPIYILWKLIAMFILITCKLYILVWNKDHVTSELKTADSTIKGNFGKN